MQPIDLSEILTFIDKNFDNLCKSKVDPWYQFTEEVFSITRHDGSKLCYQKTPYTEQPRKDLWNGYIDPFLIELSEQVIELALEGTKNQPDETILRALEKTEMLLGDAINKVFEQMAQVDQKLLSQAGMKNVKRKSIDAEETIITDWVACHIEQAMPAIRKHHTPESNTTFIIVGVIITMMLFLFLAS